MFLKINNKIFNLLNKTDIKNLKNLLEKNELFLIEGFYLKNNNNKTILSLNELEDIIVTYENLINKAFSGNFIYNELFDNKFKKVFEYFLIDKIYKEINKTDFNKNPEQITEVKSKFNTPFQVIVNLKTKTKNNKPKLYIDIDVISDIEAEKLLEIYENIRNFLFLKKLTKKQKKDILNELKKIKDLKNIKETKIGFLILDPLDKIKFYKLYYRLYNKKYLEKKENKKINIANNNNENIIFDFTKINEQTDLIKKDIKTIENFNNKNNYKFDFDEEETNFFVFDSN